MKLLPRIVDKAFCINLDRRPGRWAAAAAEFEKHNLDVRRFAAIDGMEFNKHYPMDNGNNGCTLSHYFIIEQAKLLGLKAVMIFEDDVELHPNFNALLEKCLIDIPEHWDMLYFGGTHREPTIYITDFVRRVTKTLTTHAYIIREPMYDVVIENFKNLDNPVDCFYAAWQKDYNVCITNPPLAWQRGGYSDICHRDMEYPWIKSNEQPNN